MINQFDLGPAMRWGLGLVGLLAAVFALYLAHTIFVPTVIALLLAAMLWPAVVWLHQSLKFSWTFSCLLMVLALVALNLLVTVGFGVSITKMLQDIPRPDHVEGQKEVYVKFRESLQQISPVPLEDIGLPADPEKSAVFTQFQRTLNGDFLTKALWDLTWYANNWIWQWILIMFLLLFMLLEGPILSRRVTEIFGPSEEAKAHALRALSEMALQVRTYLVWRTIINFALALLVGAVYQWLGLRQPWTWAIITAILCYIPYLGPLVAGIFPVVDAFITVSPFTALEVLIFYLIIITLEGYVIVPVVMGRSMELNATTVILACLFWELLWGLPGLFLAMPLMAGIKAICENVPDWQPWANLMSTRATELAPDTDRLAPNANASNIDPTQIMMPEEMDGADKKQGRATGEKRMKHG
jgi:predicted PurR-regulated permease PerM